MTVEAIDGFGRLTITQLSKVTKMSRATVQRRLSQAGVQPCGTKDRYAVYWLGDVLPALYEFDGASARNPELMSPNDRLCYYKAADAELDHLVRQGALVPAERMREQLFRAFKILSRDLETLPDILERDFSLTPAAVAGVEKVLDRTRESIHSHLTADASRKTRSA